jgi:hypothetical protein
MLDKVKVLEARQEAHKWRGPLGRARQVQADFLAYLDALNLSPAPRLPDNHDCWERQDGVLADDLVAMQGEPL